MRRLGRLIACRRGEGIAVDLAVSGQHVPGRELALSGWSRMGPPLAADHQHGGHPAGAACNDRCALSRLRRCGPDRHKHR